MSLFKISLNGLMAVFACLPILVAPWFFAAWEMWWFWPFIVCVSAALACFSLRLILWGSSGVWAPARPRAAALAALGYGAFLLYALFRFVHAEVFMDAERSFLLFFTPFALALVIVFGFSGTQLKWLSVLLMVNLFGLALYGVLNHYITGSERVLWEPGYPQYIVEWRATGTYFCPDHFAGVMELACCLGLGLLLAREPRWYTKGMAAGLVAIAAWDIVLSKSRGGGLTLVVVCLVAVVVGFSQRRAAVRWLMRAAAVALLGAVILAAVFRGGDYVERFKQYPWDRIRASDRYQMAAAAMRAWRTAPVFGIGPGMHQNLWPHFAATPDGDREKGRWPTHPNSTFHSYEVHSDWTQLLEEYGAVGLGLFLAAAGGGLAVLMIGRARALTRMRRSGEPTPYYWQIQGAIFAVAAMAFHSIGDFNLQMPATVWMLAAIVSMPLANVLRDPRMGAA